MNKAILLTLLIFVPTTCFSQSKGFSNPDSILIANNKLPKVLLVGSFHFNYPGMDTHKTKGEDRINIFSEKRQKELSELLEYISKFKPTKIAVEQGRNTGFLKWRLKEWKNGNRPLQASETEQIGLRLMDKFKLDTIYGVNDWGLLREMNYERVKLEKPAKTYMDSIFDSNYYGGEDEISKRYTEFYEYKEKAILQNTLLETFKDMNSDKVLDRAFGAYIAGGHFISENDEGPDALSTLWFNRNLRIYRNIKRIDYDENDRILIIFGSAHIAILKWLFQCDPTFELIKFSDLENH